MKRVVVLLVLLAGGVAHAGRNTSTDPVCEHEGAPIVDLYSFGNGALVFEKFGHSMLCLTYPDTPTICFNYGITDFSDPAAVVWRFLRAKAKFWVDGEDLHSMLAFYGSPDATRFAVMPEGVHPRNDCLLLTRRGCGAPGYGEDRMIWRQRLPLTEEQALAIKGKLCHDVEPANKYYTYHHFKDNCTTRLRDMIDEVYGGKLRAGSDRPFPMTFRDFGRRGLAEYTPIVGLSDFIGGRNLDVHPTEWEAMFHPELLRQAVEEKLGVPAEVIYQRRGPDFPEEGASGRPWAIAVTLLFSAPLALAQWKRRRERLATGVALVPVVLMSLLLWSMVILIAIDWIRWNEVVLLYLPTDVALFFLGPERRRRYAQLRVAEIALVSLLAAIGVFRQPVWIPALCVFVPMALIAFEPARRARERLSATTPAAG